MWRTSPIFLVCLFIASFLSAQNGNPAEYVIVPDDIGKAYREAEVALLDKDYDKALKSFKRVLRKYPEFVPGLRGVGACYELLNEYELAAEHYEKALEINPRFSRALYFECANAHFKGGNYFMALELFQEFDTLSQLNINQFSYNGIAEKEAEVNYYAKLKRNIRACHVAMDSVKFWNIPSVTNLGQNINGKGDEYFPVLSNDQKIIFYTSRKDEMADENLLVSTAPFGKWRISQDVGKNFNSSYNEGMPTLVRDGRQMFFTACQREEILGTCDIWAASLEGEKVKSTSPLIGYVNSPSWESQAAVSCDGSFLYFASNREGGEGGTDIWVCHRLDDGRWGKPRNLGPEINTEGDEEAPFITNDGKVLYFSSTGHLGLGEQDIFFSRRDEDGAWGEAINLGIPVNSSYRELGFFLSADGKTGYFASNRKGGFGGMDIYKFTLSEQLFSDAITFVEGYVLDSVLKTPIQTTVWFKNRTSVQTDSLGRFFLCVKAKDLLDFQIRAKDYHPFKGKKRIPNWDNKVFFPMQILLDPLFRLPVYSGPLDTEPEVNTTASPFAREIKHEIFFGFDESDLDVDKKEALITFLSNTFSGESVSGVEIVGFADDIGEDAYNLILSERRAKAVGSFLKDRGIRVDKIYIEGRGETDGGKPKWQNRKVEVVVKLENG